MSRVEGRESRVEGRGSRVEVNKYFFRVYLFVEGPMSRVEGNIFFSGFVFFTLCCRLDFHRLVESGLGGGVQPASQNPYPIYDENLRHSLPYL